MLQSLQLPQPLIKRLQQVAKRQNRSIPDTVAALIAQAEPLPNLPDDIEYELAALPSLPDEVLLTLVHNPMPRAQQEELSHLNDKAQRIGSLTSTEQKQQQYLSKLYQRAVLRRTHCLNILNKRGHNLSELLNMPYDSVL